VFRFAQRPPSNQGVQRTPLARPLGWARFTRQNACASGVRMFFPQPGGGAARIAWQLPPAAVLHPSYARLRRS